MPVIGRDYFGPLKNLLYSYRERGSHAIRISKSQFYVTQMFYVEGLFVIRGQIDDYSNNYCEGRLFIIRTFAGPNSDLPQILSRRGKNFNFRNNRKINILGYSRTTGWLTLDLYLL